VTAIKSLVIGLLPGGKVITSPNKVLKRRETS